MKLILTILAAILIVSLTSCESQSGITKKSMEKYNPTPTPPILPPPTEPPIDPADIITVDTTVEGDRLSVNGPNQKKAITCTKYNQAIINSSDNVVTIKGACRQIMVNGDRNEITADAVAEIVINGSENDIRYSRYANGKRPIVTENKPGNVIEKIPTSPSRK